MTTIHFDDNQFPYLHDNSNVADTPAYSRALVQRISDALAAGIITIRDTGIKYASAAVGHSPNLAPHSHQQLRLTVDDNPESLVEAYGDGRLRVTADGGGGYLLLGTLSDGDGGSQASWHEATLRRIRGDDDQFIATDLRSRPAWAKLQLFGFHRLNPDDVIYLTTSADSTHTIHSGSVTLVRLI